MPKRAGLCPRTDRPSSSGSSRSARPPAGRPTTAAGLRPHRAGPGRSAVGDEVVRQHHRRRPRARHRRLARRALEPRPAATWSGPGRGHIMKLRYTSLQADTGAPRRAAAAARRPRRRAGRRLHGPQPGGVRRGRVQARRAREPARLRDDRRRRAAARAVRPRARCRAAGSSTATVTAGHAFGGDLEAVNVPSALILARHVLDADAWSSAWAPGWSAPAPELGHHRHRGGRRPRRRRRARRRARAVRAGVAGRPAAAPQRRQPPHRDRARLARPGVHVVRCPPAWASTTAGTPRRAWSTSPTWRWCSTPTASGSPPWAAAPTTTRVLRRRRRGRARSPAAARCVAVAMTARRSSSGC